MAGVAALLTEGWYLVNEPRALFLLFVFLNVSFALCGILVEFCYFVV
jgi:hypothetical protein